MGGTIIETESEKLIRKGKVEGKAEEIIEMGQEFGLKDAEILKRLQEKTGLSPEAAAAYLKQYEKHSGIPSQTQKCCFFRYCVGGLPTILLNTVIKLGT